ncbi:MAG TPA: (Fe-S)-binding protein [Bryobacteraceae bacterium]|nr:(Fe-S)-binding protein [Bryobacteraceae bacterium]
MMPRVSIFVTCLVDQIFPRVGLAMADVLERAGCEIDFRDAQTCCGQPAFNSGYREEARAVAEYFLKVFEGAEYIVVPSGSCASMICHHYSDLLENHRESRVWEFSQFLVEVLKVTDLGARRNAAATYHDSCHALRELGVKAAPRRLLENVRGLRLIEMDAAEECCGFGGTFSVKFPEVSGAIARTKIESIVRSGAEIVVSADASCLMQIQGALSRAGSPIRAMHLAEVLASQ